MNLELIDKDSTLI